MNPLKWKREQRIALIIAIVLGAALGPVIGYFLGAIATGSDGFVSFGHWVLRPLRWPVIQWALFGAAISAGHFYMRRLNSN
jgi:hypothetical protein